MKLEQRVWFLANLFLALIAVLSLRLVYWQLVRGPGLQPVAIEVLSQRVKTGPISKEAPPVTNLEDLPQPVIQRTAELMKRITRGSILDRDGEPLAYDERDADGNRRRVYTDPAFALLTGYVSGLRTGVAGIEATYNETLLGLNRPDVQFGQMIGQPIVGSDVVLTVDRQLQDAADEALAGRAGAIVVVDGESGAVLAMASRPSYDPNQVLDEGYAARLLENCGDDPDCSAPFLNRATLGLFTPGSTFKTVTLIAALDTGLVDEDTIFNFGKPRQGPNGSYYVYEVDGGIIPDPNHKEARLPLDLAYAKSANAAFARMGDEMGAATLIEYANRLGFSPPDPTRFPFDLPESESQLANDLEALDDNNLLRASTAIGQGELLATPLNMTRVVLAVINDGNMPLPYLVSSTRTPSGITFNGPLEGRTLRRTMKASTARLVREMMITAVKEGSGYAAQVPGMVVGGKTGTAQLGGRLSPHAWFIGFAEKGDQSVAMAILLEQSGGGAQNAAPIFARLAKMALGD